MDHEVNTQVKTSQDTKINQEKTSQEGYMTDPLATDLKAAYSDLGLTTIDDQLQSRSNMSIKEEQRQEETMMSHTATRKQTRNQHSDQLTTDWSTTGQPTLHNVGSLTYCMGEHETWGNNTSIQGPRSQGPRTLLVVITETTK